MIELFKFAPSDDPEVWDRRAAAWVRSAEAWKPTDPEFAYGHAVAEQARKEAARLRAAAR